MEIPPGRGTAGRIPGRVRPSSPDRGRTDVRDACDAEQRPYAEEAGPRTYVGARCPIHRHHPLQLKRHWPGAPCRSWLVAVDLPSPTPKRSMPVVARARASRTCQHGRPAARAINTAETGSGQWVCFDVCFFHLIRERDRAVRRGRPQRRRRDDDDRGGGAQAACVQQADD